MCTRNRDSIVTMNPDSEIVVSVTSLCDSEFRNHYHNAVFLVAETRLVASNLQSVDLFFKKNQWTKIKMEMKSTALKMPAAAVSTGHHRRTYGSASNGPLSSRDRRRKSTDTFLCFRSKMLRQLAQRIRTKTPASSLIRSDIVYSCGLSGGWSLHECAKLETGCR